MRFAAVFLVLALFGSTTVRAEPLDAAVEARVQAIHARNPDRRDDAFAKMGGSSIASKAFLYCFASPYVDLGDRQELAETVEYFKTGRRNSFNRESLSAGVSWNLRYALGGRPAHFREEIRATNARWALVLFGGNDAQNKNERIYARRLIYLIEQLQELGVVPVLGSAAPRRDKTKDRWIQRFNAITEAVAAHWQLPYIDYHSAMRALPRQGLARDGVHPNVLSPGGVRAACQLTDKGLRYGNNLRNLMTLEMLDALRRGFAGAATAAETASATVSAAEPATVSATAAETVPAPVSATAPATETASATETGTEAASVPVSAPVSAPVRANVLEPVNLTAADLPFSTLIDKSALPEGGSVPAGCGRLKPRARGYRIRVQLDARTRLRASALDIDGYNPRVFWVRIGEEGERCVRRRNQTLEVDAREGSWDLIIEVTERAAEKGDLLILIDRNPR